MPPATAPVSVERAPRETSFREPKVSGVISKGPPRCHQATFHVKRSMVVEEGHQGRGRRSPTTRWKPPLSGAALLSHSRGALTHRGWVRCRPSHVTHPRVSDERVSIRTPVTSTHVMFHVKQPAVAGARASLLLVSCRRESPKIESGSGRKDGRVRLIHMRMNAARATRYALRTAMFPAPPCRLRCLAHSGERQSRCDYFASTVVVSRVTIVVGLPARAAQGPTASRRSRVARAGACPVCRALGHCLTYEARPLHARTPPGGLRPQTSRADLRSLTYGQG